MQDQKKEKKHAGRPRVLERVDLEDVKELAAEGVSTRAIARTVGIHERTLFAKPEVRKAYEEGRADMEINLRHWQMTTAKSGNTQMLIHMENILTGGTGAVQGVNDPAVKILNQHLTDAEKIKVCKECGLETADKPTVKDFILASLVVMAEESGKLTSAQRFLSMLSDLGIGCAKKTEEEMIKDLKRVQLRQAETSPQMAVWLGKQYLGQTENPEGNIDTEDVDAYFTEAGLNGKPED